MEWTSAIIASLIIGTLKIFMKSESKYAYLAEEIFNYVVGGVLIILFLMWIFG